MKRRAPIVSAPASLVLGLVAVLACASGEEVSSSATAITGMTATMTTPATASASTGATTATETATAATETATAAMTTGTTEASPTTSEGTDSATDPTTDPTAGTTTDTGSSGSFCVHQCASDMDCRVDGQDAGLTCKDSLCTTGESTTCTDNAECVALYSSWTGTPCTSGGGECTADLQRCVQLPDGGGGCAYAPGDFFMCASVPGWVEVMVPDIDGNEVTVCGNPLAECNAEGVCFVACNSDADCTNDAFPICNPETRLCGCGSDDDCATLQSPHLSVCHAGSCGCGADSQCVDGGQGDVCNAGLCGCSGDVCNAGLCGCSGDAGCANVTNHYDGGAIVCRSL